MLLLATIFSSQASPEQRNSLTICKWDKSGLQEATLGQVIPLHRDPFEIRSGWYEAMCWSTNMPIRFQQPLSTEERGEVPLHATSAYGSALKYLSSASLPPQNKPGAQLRHVSPPLGSNDALLELSRGISLLLFIASEVLTSNFTSLRDDVRGLQKLKNAAPKLSGSRLCPVEISILSSLRITFLFCLAATSM